MRLKYGYRKIIMTLSQTICYNRFTLHAGKNGVRSAVVGALVPMLEKSAIKNKKLHKYKSTIQLVSFNLRTLNRRG